MDKHLLISTQKMVQMVIIQMVTQMMKQFWLLNFLKVLGLKEFWDQEKEESEKTIIFNNSINFVIQI